MQSPLFCTLCNSHNAGNSRLCILRMHSNIRPMRHFIFSPPPLHKAKTSKYELLSIRFMYLLQNESFATGHFLLLVTVLGFVLGMQRWFSVYFGYSKADRESSHGLAVENFLSFIYDAIFFSG